VDDEIGQEYASDGSGQATQTSLVKKRRLHDGESLLLREKLSPTYPTTCARPWSKSTRPTVRTSLAEVGRKFAEYPWGELLTVILFGMALKRFRTLGGFGSGLALGGAFVLAGELAVAEGDHQRAFRRYDAIMHDYAKIARRGNGGAFLAPRSRWLITARDALFSNRLMPKVMLNATNPATPPRTAYPTIPSSHDR
jgi:2-polyprenyl-6-methoxyphenol hydroxylase-like FAD-dependent oxidoreductase